MKRKGGGAYLGDCGVGYMYDRNRIGGTGKGGNVRNSNGISARNGCETWNSHGIDGIRTGNSNGIGGNSLGRGGDGIRVSRNAVNTMNSGLGRVVGGLVGIVVDRDHNFGAGNAARVERLLGRRDGGLVIL